MRHQPIRKCQLGKTSKPHSAIGELIRLPQILSSAFPLLADCVLEGKQVLIQARLHRFLFNFENPQKDKSLPCQFLRIFLLMFVAGLMTIFDSLSYPVAKVAGEAARSASFQCNRN